jgi:hypothetical protein
LKLRLSVAYAILQFAENSVTIWVIKFTTWHKKCQVFY